MVELIPWLLVAACLFVILIHYNVWRLLDEAKRHNQATEALLAEIRDRLVGAGRAG
jgi:large-conductance mechanosensitive channel